MNEERRNHRKLGAELELFMTNDAAPGMPFYLPKGMVLRNQLEEYWRNKHVEHSYQEIKTPVMMKQELWEQSGHWDHYHENMYFSPVDGENYAVKPMNCPGAVLIFNSKRRSYRELPVRYAELGLVHRHELSGSLNGLLRVRAFTQDDAHLFVREDQIKAEISNVLAMIDEFYKKFGFSYRVELSTRPDKFMGAIDQWNAAESALKAVLDASGMQYAINEGDGAFYGPKIDFHLLDSLGRSWQCGTVQLDFQMPEKFGCRYIGDDNKEHQPIMIHRAIYGSLERFIAILLEHYEGDFPLWLASVQVKILSISDNQLPYAKNVAQKIQNAGFRTAIDERAEKVGLKIREAEMEKVPYMLVIGGKEQAEDAVSVRKRKTGDLGKLPIEAFIEVLHKEV